MSLWINKTIAGKPSGRVAWLLLFAVVLPAGGCGDDAGGRRAVFGTVTLKGQPVDMGIITFIRAEGGTVFQSGGVVANGRYEMPKDKGLIPGRYKVSISYPDKHNKLGGDELPGPT